MKSNLPLKQTANNRKDAELKVFSTVAETRHWCRQQLRENHSIGFAPTMGALHEGHLSLVRQANEQCDRSVVSIFVNPTQFAPHEDLDQYPRPIENDLALLKQAGTHAVFLPSVQEMYPGDPGDASTKVLPSSVALPLEGVHRPDHFVGVATVVMKLLQIVPADRAFFGRKDFQQLCVIEHMARDLSMATDIVPCPIVREEDGLAMSSRNRYLSTEERKRALCLSKALQAVQQAFDAGQRDPSELELVMKELLKPCDNLDYAVVVDRESLLPVSKITRSAVALIAARIGKTRLIDNCELTLANNV